MTLSQLASSLARHEATRVHFTEERRLQVLTEPLRLEGTLAFEPPARLERQVLSPKPERMVADGNLLTIENNPRDPPLRVLLSDYPGLDALLTALRATLRGDTETLERLYDATVEGSAESWTLRLVPRSPAIREAVREVKIRGRSDRITVIDVLEPSGDQTVITIHGEI